MWRFSKVFTPNYFPVDMIIKTDDEESRDYNNNIVTYYLVCYCTKGTTDQAFYFLSHQLYEKNKEKEKTVLHRFFEAYHRPHSSSFGFRYRLISGIEKVTEDQLDLNAIITLKIENSSGSLTRTTPLLAAIDSDKTIIVRDLLSQPDININLIVKIHNFRLMDRVESFGKEELSDDYQTPLTYAIVKGNIPVMKLLLAREEVNLNIPEKSPPLHRAIMHRNIEAIELLLNHPRLDFTKQKETAFKAVEDAIKLYSNLRDQETGNHNGSKVEYSSNIAALEIIKAKLEAKVFAGQNPLETPLRDFSRRP